MAANEQVLYDNGGGLVWLEPGGRTVRKEYDFHDPEVSRALAQTEFDRLTQMEPVFAHVPGLRSPRPLAISASEADDPPTVTMEFCPGVELAVALGDPALSDDTLRSIADRMAIAAVAFVDTIGEPYIDFSFHNALYDAESDTVTVLDFISTPFRGPANNPLQPLERTLGNALAMVLRELPSRARHASLRHRWRLARVVARTIAQAQRRAGPLPVHPQGVNERAARGYRRYASRHSLWHQLWFRTVGAALAFFVLHTYRRLAI